MAGEEKKPHESSAPQSSWHWVQPRQLPGCLHAVPACQPSRKHRARSQPSEQQSTALGQEEQCVAVTGPLLRVRTARGHPLSPGRGERLGTALLGVGAPVHQEPIWLHCDCIL